MRSGHSAGFSKELDSATLIEPIAGTHNKKEMPLMQVLVRDNNVDQALKVLKKKMQREGVFRELKRKSFYEKPSERRAREKGEAIRRARKLARKRAQREGLLPPTPRRPENPRGFPGRPTSPRPTGA
jgi:small subunit ribosomal protein S21